MRIIVTVGAPDHGVPLTRQVIEPGVTHLMNVTSPWLVSRGQQFPISVHVDIADGANEHRSLVDILAEAVQHGKDNPTHGGNCACLDRLVREIKQQINTVLPSHVEEAEWKRRMDARWRITYLLNTASRYL